MIVIQRIRNCYKGQNYRTLYNRRLQDIAILMYKVKNGLCPDYISRLFIFLFFNFFINICNATYKNIQYTTLLALLALLTTQDYITFSFPFTYTEREKNEKKRKTKKKGKILPTTFVL